MKKSPTAVDDTSPAKEAGSRRKLTRAEEVRAKLADDIVDGKLSPGMPLDETEIAASYGVSRTPLREAIRDLAAMGLVETRPHRSAIVTRPSPEHLRQMFQVMAELEALCASLAAAHMSLSERRKLETIHEGLAQILKENDPSHYHVLNEKFHAAIYAGSQNAYLVEITLATRRRLSPFRRAQFLTAGRLAKSYKEHDLILVAILQGNRELAAETMRRHILTVEDSYEEYAGLKVT
ncbi:GntR family transcriptional regulator [Neorhizobium alkalisoli]|uniref:GntR family transcriptional regulator n=1 Tax=Neorhizobium alkalisoli TaxID=528178 RepID=A0A561QPQ7_9HYPH|nr:GntR family transcriptional regulator [Neorhizobium alkalisoli]TWF52319.1 GntR family transcriptional regulator [Neorhizobium alkalisoli]